MLVGRLAIYGHVYALAKPSSLREKESKSI